MAQEIEQPVVSGRISDLTPDEKIAYDQAMKRGDHPDVAYKVAKATSKGKAQYSGIPYGGQKGAIELPTGKIQTPEQRKAAQLKQVTDIQSGAAFKPSVVPTAGSVAKTPDSVKTGGTKPGQIAAMSSLFGKPPISEAQMKAVAEGMGGAPTPFPQGQAPSGGGQESGWDSMMRDLNKPIDPSVVLAGLMPTMQGHQMDIPPSMLQPLQPFQQQAYLPASYAEGVVGKKAAGRAGIANAIIGVGNAVGAINNKLQQQQHEKTATATQRLIRAQQTIDQASQYLKQKGITPEQSAQLQKRIDDSKMLMNTILSDPKMRKAIGKGMDVSFTDPSENKTPEHQAVGAGKQAALNQPQGQTFQAQFAKQMPQTMGQDPMAQFRLQQAITQKQSDQALAKAMLPRLATAQSQQEIAAVKEAGAEVRQARGFQNQWGLQANRFAQTQWLQAQGHAFKLDEIGKHIQWQGDMLQKLAADKQLSPLAIGKYEQQGNYQWGQLEAHYKGQLDQLQTDYSTQAANYAKTTNKDQKAEIAKGMQQNRQAYQMGLEMLQNLNAPNGPKANFYRGVTALRNIAAGGDVGGYDPEAESGGDEEGGGGNEYTSGADFGISAVTEGVSILPSTTP